MIKGRKRHIAVDTPGHLLHCEVHKANIADTTAGGYVFERILWKYPNLQGVSFDEGYRGRTRDYVEKLLGKIVEIPKESSIYGKFYRKDGW